MSSLIPFLSCRSGKKKRRQENVANPEESSAPLSACSSSRRDSESLYLEVSFEFDSKISGTLQAKRGDVVCQINAINGWLLVRAEDGREGYIPAGYCSPYVSEQAEESSPSATAAAGLSVMSISSGIGLSIGNSQSREDGLRDSDSARQDTPDIQNLGTAIAVFDFLAERTTEVSMLRGDRMTVVSDGDPDWLRVLTEEGLEGLVPKSYVFRPARSEASPVSDMLWMHEPSDQQFENKREWYEHELNDNISEGIVNDTLIQLVAIQDYQGDDKIFLSVREGEILFTDISDKRDNGWLKVHSICQGKGGLIPSLYARTHSRPSTYISYKRSDGWDDTSGDYSETQV